MCVVESYLDRHPGLLQELAKAPTLAPPAVPPAPAIDWSNLIESPPDQIVKPVSREKPWLTRRGRRTDFAELDALNRRLGKLGEEFVVNVEKHRLLSLGRDDLAQRVQWLSQSVGDGLGFDVLSFDDANDSERFLEVKTTGLGKHFPFYVSLNEVNCSKDVPDQYHLYRVFDFSRSPRLYILQGSLDTLCQLEPIQFRATLGR